MQNGVHFIKQ